MAGNDVVEIPIANEDRLSHLDTPGVYVPATLAAPASELFSVTLSPKYFGQRDTCEIYGTIILDDEDGNSYELYSRPSDDPETLTPQHNSLSLDILPECLVSTTWLRMSLCLNDKAHGDGIVIVDQVFYFDKLAYINQYNRVNVRPLADDSVIVTYAALPAAVVAFLDITLIKTEDNAPADVNLSGKIVARYGNTYGDKYPGIMLFDKPSNESIKAVSNIPIVLSRDVVVVPAYSFLRIDLHLSQPYSYQQDDIICRAEFLARDYIYDDLDINTKDFVVRFNVEWCHPYVLRNEPKPPFKRLKMSNDLQVHDDSREDSLRNHGIDVYSLLEVYTVTIHQDTNSLVKICGTIGVNDNVSTSSLFNRSEQNPVILSGNEETVPIDVKRRCFYMAEYLAMGLQLRDVEGRILIEGQIYWNDDRVKHSITWFDKRICSIIRGVHGYAAVFYTIFSKAVQASVKISFECNEYPDISHCVKGTVFARHSNETYLTEHDTTYYQSVLFRGDSSNLKSGCTLPLSKSVVAVPIDAFLTVGVNLYASCPTRELPEEHLTLEVDFKRGPDIKRIEGKNYSIKVSVGWSDLHKLFSEDWDLNLKN